MTRAVSAFILLACAAALTGCSPAKTVPVAPMATDPVCAQIVLAVTDRLAGLPKISTTSQATAAWGTVAQAITLRCGVPVPGPTTTQCQAITDATGLAVDWLVVQDGSDWVFTTFGRSPAVEVRVPDGVSTAPIVDLNRAVSAAPAARNCL